jgi:hypothetical protein
MPFFYPPPPQDIKSIIQHGQIVTKLNSNSNNNNNNNLKITQKIPEQQARKAQNQ